MRRDSCQPPGESLEFSRLRELAVQPRRTDLQNIVRPGNQILHVEDYAQLVADGLAIPVADAFRLIDVDAQEALLADLPFHVHHFHAQRARHALGRIADALQIHFPLSVAPESGAMAHQSRQFAFRSPPNKKVGSRPLRIASGLGISSIVSRSLKSKLQKTGHQLLYVHMNPVKRHLVSHPKDCSWNSFTFYSSLKHGLIRIDLVN